MSHHKNLLYSRHKKPSRHILGIETKSGICRRLLTKKSKEHLCDLATIHRIHKTVELYDMLMCSNRDISNTPTESTSTSLQMIYIGLC